MCFTDVCQGLSCLRPNHLLCDCNTVATFVVTTVGKLGPSDQGVLQSLADVLMVL